MTIFLTFNDAPSGIFSGQVIDVVKFLRAELFIKIRLVSFISLRGFSAAREKIVRELPDAVVLPMFPGVTNWRINRFLLSVTCKFLNVERIIARGVMSTNLSLSLKRRTCKVIYDGRGAIAAEWKEYSVVNDKTLLSEIDQLEKRAIHESSACLAVSDSLVKYWQGHYGYRSDKFVVIPCTVNQVFEKFELNGVVVEAARQNLGYAENDIVFIYSGSVSGWQSFSSLHRFIAPILHRESNARLLFMTSPDANIKKFMDEFPSQVKVTSCSPKDVPAVLVAGDYGLLIREESVTNRVASPVKFAEYLSCGLEVIISDNLGDYSNFVRNTGCGHQENEEFRIKRTGITRKENLRALAMSHFTKTACVEKYRKLLAW